MKLNLSKLLNMHGSGRWHLNLSSTHQRCRACWKGLNTRAKKIEESDRIELEGEYIDVMTSLFIGKTRTCEPFRNCLIENRVPCWVHSKPTLGHRNV